MGEAIPRLGQGGVAAPSIKIAGGLRWKTRTGRFVQRPRRSVWRLNQPPCLRAICGGFAIFFMRAATPP